MNPRLALFASFALGLGLTVGCGGSSNGDLLAGGGSTGTGATSATGGSNNGGDHNGGSAGKNAGGSGNTGNTGGTGNTGNTGGTGNTGNTGGTGGGNTGGTGGGNNGGTGGGNNGAGVVQHCGNSPCNVSQGGTCCRSFQGYSCVSTNYCPNQPAASIKCDGPEDCPGQVCCGTIAQYGGQYFYSQVLCQSSCNQPNERVFCGNDPNSCPSGTQCVNSQIMPGFHACG